MSMIPIGTFGNVNPIIYGGGILYKDGDSYRVVHFDPTYESDLYDERYEDGYVDRNDNGRLLIEVRSFDVKDNVLADLSWLDNKDLDKITDRISGIDADDLRELSTDPDPRVRLKLYLIVARHLGWHYFHIYYPETTRADELKKQYGADIEAAHAYQANRRHSAAENPTLAIDTTPLRMRAALIAARLARGES